MQTILRTLRPLAIFLTAAVCLTPASVSADVLIDYWAGELMAGPGGPSGPSYFELRAEFLAKIERAEEEVRRCGGCAEAQTELDTLLAEEDQFQRTTGRLLALTGQPPIVARILGIRTDTYEYNFPFPSDYERGEGLVNTDPEWLKDRPAFCQEVVYPYLKTLKARQDTTRRSEVDYLKRPGGELYDQYRLKQACYLKDYVEFERLVELNERRDNDEILFELYPIGIRGTREKGLVYFGNTPEDFVPPMPPPDVVLGALGEDLREFRVVANKQKNDNLIQILVAPYQPIYLEGSFSDSCVQTPREQQSELLKRACDDRNEMYRYKAEAKVLLCGYRATDGIGQLARRYGIYWYHERVPVVELEYLLTRDHEHPMLVIGDARSECPATWAGSKEAMAAYEAKLASLRKQVPQTPMDVSLPESEWLVERRENYAARAAKQQQRSDRTNAYDLSGFYSLGYERLPDSGGGGAVPRRRGGRAGAPAAPVTGDCIIAKDAVSSRKLHAACWSEDRVSVGRVITGGTGPRLDVDMLPVNTFLLEDGESDVLSSDQAGGKYTLTRRGDLYRFGDYPLDGNFLLLLASGDAFLRALCTFSSVSGDRWVRMDCVDDQGRRLETLQQFSASSIDAAQTLAPKALLNYLTVMDEYHERRATISVGDVLIQELFFVIDPAFDGDEPRDATILAFARDGVLGSLQRLEPVEVGTGFADGGSQLTGRWVGEYKCAAQNTRTAKAELNLDDSATGRFRTISGTFTFDDELYGDDGRGSYAVSGEYLSDVGTMRLTAGDWVDKPRLGFAATGILATATLAGEGEAEAAAATITGDLGDNGCGELRLTRVSTTPSDITLAAAAVAPAAGGASANESGAAAVTTIEMESDTFRTGEPVVVVVTGGPDNKGAWLTLVDTRASDGGSMEYFYTDGVAEGTWTFTAPVPGNYEVRVHSDNRTVAARKRVTITK